MFPLAAVYDCCFDRLVHQEGHVRDDVEGSDHAHRPASRVLDVRALSPRSEDADVVDESQQEDFIKEISYVLTSGWVGIKLSLNDYRGQHLEVHAEDLEYRVIPQVADGEAHHKSSNEEEKAHQDDLTTLVQVKTLVHLTKPGLHLLVLELTEPCVHEVKHEQGQQDDENQAHDGANTRNP